MKPFLLVLILLLIHTASASPFTEILHIAGLGVETNPYDFSSVSSWSFNREGETIVRVQHDIESGTVVHETYYYGTSSINSTFDCSWAWLSDTCNLHLDSGNQSMDYVYTDISLIPRTKTVIFTLLADLNGTAGVGLGVEQISTSYLYSSIFISALADTPMQALQGSSSAPLDMTVETLTYTQFSEYQQQVTDVTNGSWVDRMLDMAYTFWGIITSAFYFFKLLFWDHPILTFALIEIFALMYALDAKNMMQWWKRFAEIHIKAYGFVLEFIHHVVDIVTNIINALKPT